jgi:hypothetical protein
MRHRCTALISLLMLLASGSFTCAAKPSAVTPETPVWFAGKETHGLCVGLRSICAGGKLLSLDHSPVDAYGACYYPSAGILMTVGNDTTVRLYEGAGGQLVLRKSQLLRSKSHPVSLRFTRVPGLVYVTYDFVPPPPPPEPKQGFFQSLWSRVTGRRPTQTRCINNLSQHYTWECRRVVMRDSARNWYGIPTGDSYRYTNAEAMAVEGCCHVLDGGKRLMVGTADGRWAILRLPHLSLSETMDRWDMQQAVWISPGHGILCRTEGGWSLYQTDGTLIKWFPCSRDHYWWYDASFTGDSFRVFEKIGPGGNVYRLDMPTGRLVQEEWSEKKHKYVAVTSQH